MDYWEQQKRIAHAQQEAQERRRRKDRSEHRRKLYEKYKKVDPQRYRDYSARHRDRNRERVNARERERRRKAYEADPVVNICLECLVSWCPLYCAKRKRRDFCCDRCQKRHYARRTRKPPTMDTTLKARIIDLLGTIPWQTCAAVRAAVKGKSGSVKRALWIGCKNGVFVRRKRGPRFEYALSEGKK